MEVETVAANETAGGALEKGIAQLMAAAEQMERTAAAIEARFAGSAGLGGGDVPRLVATVETDPSARLAELEAKLHAAEARITELSAQASAPAGAARKTLPAAAAQLLAKHGMDTLDQVNAGALDAALSGLSLEQRIAVKSQMMRAGLLG